MVNQEYNAHDMELISSYVDGALSGTDRVEFERRLAQDANLQADVDSLRATVALLHELPRLKAPRNFTLDPALYGKKAAKVVRWQMWRLSSSIGLAASIMLVMAGLVLSNGRTANEMAQTDDLAGNNTTTQKMPDAAAADTNTLVDPQSEMTALAFAPTVEAVAFATPTALATQFAEEPDAGDSADESALADDTAIAGSDLAMDDASGNAGDTDAAEESESMPAPQATMSQVDIYDQGAIDSEMPSDAARGMGGGGGDDGEGGITTYNGDDDMGGMPAAGGGVDDEFGGVPPLPPDGLMPPMTFVPDGNSGADSTTMAAEAPTGQGIATKTALYEAEAEDDNQLARWLILLGTGGALLTMGSLLYIIKQT